MGTPTPVGSYREARRPVARGSWDRSAAGVGPVPRARLRLMTDFQVAYANGVLTAYSGDGARYEINPQSGVLTVFDGDGKRFHFSPAGWLSVGDEAPVSVYETHGAKSV